MKKFFVVLALAALPIAPTAHAESPFSKEQVEGCIVGTYGTAIIGALASIDMRSLTPLRAAGPAMPLACAAGGYGATRADAAPAEAVSQDSLNNEANDENE